VRAVSSKSRQPHQSKGKEGEVQGHSQACNLQARMNNYGKHAQVLHQARFNRIRISNS